SSDNTRNSICLVVFIQGGPYHIFLPGQSASLKTGGAAKIVSGKRSRGSIFSKESDLRDRLDGCGFSIPRAGNSVGNGRAVEHRSGRIRNAGKDMPDLAILLGTTVGAAPIRYAAQARKRGERAIENA